MLKMCKAVSPACAGGQGGEMSGEMGVLVHNTVSFRSETIFKLLPYF